MLLLALWIIIHVPAVQNRLVHFATTQLSNTLKTKVEVKHVDFSLFNRIRIQGVRIEDKRKDTLLYAGSVSVKISDWFFLKDDFTLYYLGIEDALIQTNRTDSTWNYNFILDALASPGRQQKSAPSKSSALNVKFDIRELELKNIKYITADAWRGEDQKITIGSLELNAKSIDLTKRRIDVERISIEDPIFTLRQYEGKRPDSLIPKTEPRIPGQLYWNPDQWNITAKKINIRHGLFKSDLDTQREPFPYFDGAHLLFGDIDATLSDIAFVDDTLRSTIQVTTKERSGLYVTSLRARLKMDPTQMAFNQLDLNTPYSHLGNSLVMRYAYFTDDMADFVNKVDLRGEILNSNIDLRDIGFFAPVLKEKAINVKINGLVEGKVNKLFAKGVQVNYKNNTSVKGDLSIEGLPDTDKTRYRLTNTLVQSRIAELRTILPDLEKNLGLKLDSLDRIAFRGNVSSYENSLDVSGMVSTSAGNISTKMNIKNMTGSNLQINASGNISAFELGRFFNISSLGKTSGQYLVKGKNSNDIQFEALLDSIQFNGYTYREIKSGGYYSNRKINLDLDIDDENLKAGLIGYMDLSGKKPSTKVDIRVFSSMLDKLNITQLPLNFSGSSRISFEGIDINDIVGTAQFDDLTILKEEQLFRFDSLRITAENTGSFRSITMVGNDIDARVNGNFEINELPNTFNQYFSNYYPLYFKKVSLPKKDQNVYFRFDLKNASSILKVLDMGIGGLNYSFMEGSMDTKSKRFSFNATIPKLVYNKVAVYDFMLNAEGTTDSLIMHATTSSIVLNDSLFFPKNNINIRSSKDISSLEINSFSDRSQYGAQLSADVKNLEDGIRIHFNKSSLVFNDKTWNIKDDGEVVISKRILEAKDLQITNGDQLIGIITLPPESNRSQTIVLSLSKVNLGDLVPLVFKEPRIQGITTGDLTLEDPFNNLKLYLNAQTDKTMFEDDSIGITTMNAFWDSKEKRASYFFESDNPNYKVYVKGKYENQDSTSTGEIDMDINVDNMKLSILEPYLKIVFNRIDGTGTGKLRISGNVNQPDLTGTIDVKDGKINVAYTQCAYSLRNSTITFKPGQIDLGTIEMKDIYGNQAQLKGTLEHRFFSAFKYNINASSRKLLVLNTNKLDNNLFYGRAIARFNFSMTGPEEQMNMFVSGTPVDSSNIDINTTSGSKQTADVDYIVWKTYGKEIAGDTSVSSSNLIIDLDLNASPLLTMNVILDELTGDIISGRGSGNLKIHTGTKENLTMIGRYNIESGNYNFNFQDVFKKPFKLEGGGSSYISWTGDPYNAEININAVYLAEKVRMSTLFNDPSNTSVSSVSSDVLREITDVEVKCNLSGTLAKPNPGFQIVIPQTSTARNNTTIDSKLKTINRDPLEASKQATYLIVFKGFAPQAAVVATDLNSQLINTTISGVINGILSNSIQNFFSKILGSSVDVNFNYSRNLSALGGTAQSSGRQGNFRENVSLQFIKSMMNDKLVITFGSDFNFSATGGSNIAGGQSFLFLPDVNVEYKITPDGKFRTSFFYRSKFDVLSSSGKRDRTGGNVSFRTEFDRIFEGKKKNP